MSKRGNKKYTKEFKRSLANKRHPPEVSRLRPQYELEQCRQRIFDYGGLGIDQYSDMEELSVSERTSKIHLENSRRALGLGDFRTPHHFDEEDFHEGNIT